MARRSWPVAVDPVSGALMWESGSGLTATLLAQSVGNTAGAAVSWTGGATSDVWPVAVQHQTGALTYSGAGTSLTYSLLFDARNLALSNGAAVSTWADTSGNSRDATQGTGANQPVYSTTGINGLPSVTFDGSKFMATPVVSPAGLSATGLFTLFAVVKCTTAAGTNSFFDHDNAGTVRNFQSRITTTIAESIAFNSGGTPFTDTQTGATTSTAHVISIVRDTTTVQVFVDGTGAASTATTGSPVTSASTAAVILGASGTGATQRFTGEIGYLAYVQGAVSAATRQATEAALKAIWGTP